MSIMHPVSAERVTTVALVRRAAALNAWPADAADATTRDPRCGCGADAEGGSCYWDSTTQIAAELEQRAFILWNVTGKRAPYEVRTATNEEWALVELGHLQAAFPRFRYRLTTFDEAANLGWLK